MRRAPTCIGRARAVRSRSISASGRRGRGGVRNRRSAVRAASPGATCESARLAARASGSSGEAVEDRTIVLFCIAMNSASVTVVLLPWELAALGAAGGQQRLERAGRAGAGLRIAHQARGVDEREAD